MTTQEQAQQCLQSKQAGDLRYEELVKALMARTGLPVEVVEMNIFVMAMGGVVR